MKCPLSVSAQGSYSTILNILLVFLHISLDSATPFLICEDKTAHNTQYMGALVFRCPAVLLFQALSAPKDNLINFSKLAKYFLFDTETWEMSEAPFWALSVNS